MRYITILMLIMIITGCDNRSDFPPIEAKAAKICLDAGLVPDTHMTPYRCYIPTNDPRLK